MFTPRRIVCLSAETVDVLYRLGADEAIVGVSGFARFPPEARAKPVVSGFTTIRYEVIDSLKPDLIIGFSDLQADALCALAKLGYPVVLTNQRTLEEVFETCHLIGRIVDKADEADALVRGLQCRLDTARQAVGCCDLRPKVYFEEWDEPLISGIAWIGELVEVAGGVDAFPELSRLRCAAQRIVSPAAVVERSPDIIIASWCGKQARLDTICTRHGWDKIPAVRHKHVYEIQSDYCLQPGPGLITEALPRIEAIIAKWHVEAHSRAGL